MVESVLNTDGASRAEAEGLRHGKHSLLPKRVAASHSLQLQQMRHTHTKPYRSHTFFLTLRNVHTDVSTLLLRGERVKKAEETWDECHGWGRTQSFKEKEKLL